VVTPGRAKFSALDPQSHISRVEIKKKEERHQNKKKAPNEMEDRKGSDVLHRKREIMSRFGEREEGSEIPR